MRKQEFLSALRKRLSSLPKREIEERLLFYSEMIDDRMEEGLSEEAAVRAIGAADAIAAQIMAEQPSTQGKEKQERGLGAGAILLLVLGSPI